ncbi:MAG: DUF1376 domain-containing protein [Sedimentisphaerales bacterium]|nr:DUF1376 domain-containing protein [Sedimentisphaerales bacterium]
MPRKRPKYVSLEPDAFLSDLDFQAMTAEQRGVYCTVIFYLYSNKGRMKYDENTLRKLCNVNGDFSFQTVLIKFQVRRGFIYHKRVKYELEKAQVYIDRAVKAAKARWDNQCSSNAQASPKQCQGKERDVTKRDEKESKNTIPYNNRKEQCDKDDIDTNFGDSNSNSFSLRFVSELEGILKTRSKSDRSAIRNLSNWLSLQVLAKRFDDGVFKRVVDIANESKSGRNPLAIFFSRLDKEISYRASVAKQIAKE